MGGYQGSIHDQYRVRAVLAGHGREHQQGREVLDYPTRSGLGDTRAARGPGAITPTSRSLPAPPRDSLVG
jgi:hypothetical protein